MTMEIIQRIELGSAQSTIEFTSIPQTFTDLLLVTSLRSDRGAGAVVEVTKLEFNGSTSGYSYRELVGDGSGVQSSSGSITRHGLIPAASATSNTFSNDQSYIPNYTGSTQKSFSSDTVMENNATTSYQDIVANLWTGTSAITSIRLSNVFSSNFVAGSSATLYGIKRFNTTLSPKATGGAISYDSVNNKWVHAFYTSGTFTPTENLTGVEYLVIAGGGGGGGAENTGAGGGGGAGGYRSSVVGESSGGGASAEATLSLTSGVGQTVTVGAGGAGGSGLTSGSQGSNSVFGSITATGGGGGGGLNTGAAGSGGSGGGESQNPSSGAGSGTANQGYNGGEGFNSSGTGGAGGGGGAGSAGSNASISISGAGGNGVTSGITGSSVARAGGGAGAARGVTLAGATAGGGTGGTTSTFPTAGVAATGAGGGGAGLISPFQGAAGGSGVVIIRYSA